ncbi:MAG: UDP-N-acetylglucosamine 2-epimerase, partial [Cellulosilyticum sp.]|nr:UDP-N-acetylglucosamine 2-epimerase [Cellulosilyticum sp.]
LKLAGIEKETIYTLTKELLTDEALYHTMAEAKNPFGDGEASRRIIEAMLYDFKRSDNRPKDYCYKG